MTTAGEAAFHEPRTTVDPATPYGGPEEHLDDELRRIDLLVRCTTHHWRATLASHKPEHLWGMLHVSDDEVRSYLDAPFSTGLARDATDNVHSVLVARQAAQLAERIALRLTATAEDATLPLRRLALAAGLSRAELDALLVVLLGVLEPRYRRLFAYLQDDAARAAPSVELMLQILTPLHDAPADAHALLAPWGRLVRLRLLRVTGTEHDPLSARAVHVDGHVVRFVLGAGGLPEALVGFARLHVHDDGVLKQPDLDESVVERLDALAAAWAAASATREPFPVVHVCGRSESALDAIGPEIARRVGLPALVLRCDEPSSDALDERVELACREALLHGAVLVLDLGPRTTSPSWTLALREHPGPVVLVGAHEGRLDLDSGARVLRLEIPPASHALRRRIWARHLASAPFAHIADGERAAAWLADAFRLDVRDIEAIVDRLAAETVADEGAPPPTLTDLLEGCRLRSQSRLGGMAQRLEPHTGLTFADLVLPTANLRQLDDLRARIRNRHRVLDELGFGRRVPMARGLCALFSGASGTGKTLSARLLAHEQNVDLYRIDLSSVVSMYVGETEKNLSRVFEEAERANAFLFFDEADALFGKRGEIKDARDRWANLEVNFLLQRIEDFEGVVILATNLRQNIDTAFLRRLHAIVEFPAPDDEMRRRIWLGLFPEVVARPDDEVIARLARQFALTGGSIRNVVIDAAYRAVADAPDATPTIELRHLAGALGRELQKLGRPITRSEFGDDLHPWAEAEVLG